MKLADRLISLGLPEPERTHAMALLQRAGSRLSSGALRDVDTWAAGLEYFAWRVDHLELAPRQVAERRGIPVDSLVAVLDEVRESTGFRAYVGEWIRNGEVLEIIEAPHAETIEPPEVAEDPELEVEDIPELLPDAPVPSVAASTTGRSEAVEPSPDLDLPSAWRAPFSLHPWQLAAADAWEKEGKGIVEVVTGAGKTALAVFLYARLRERLEARGERLQAVIVVPRVALAKQWKDVLEQIVDTSDLAIGEYHAGQRCFPAAQDVLIITQDSARSVLPAMHMTRPVLFIGDECHRLAAPATSRILDLPYRYTLGLSATPERSGDLGFEQILVPHLGPIVFRYGYADAVRDGILAPFDLFRIRVALSIEEQQQYQRLSTEITSLLGSLKTEYPVLSRLVGVRFFQVLGDLARRTKDERFERLTTVTAARRMIAHMAEAKFTAAQELARSIPDGRQALCFHETIEGANRVLDVLSGAGLPAAAYHTQLTLAERADNLDRLRRGSIRWLVACRALDEGLDIPSVDTAVIFAGSKAPRQTIQRLGRALRKKSDDRKAAVILVEAVGIDDRLLEQPGLAELRRAASSESIVTASEAAFRLGGANPRHVAQDDRIVQPQSWLSKVRTRLFNRSQGKSSVETRSARSSRAGRGRHGGSSWTGTPGNQSYYDKDASPD